MRLRLETKLKEYTTYKENKGPKEEILNFFCAMAVRYFMNSFSN